MSERYTGIEKYLTTQEAGELIGIKYQAVIARIRKGTLKAERKGWEYLIKRSDIVKMRKYKREKSV